ncbi:hemolysin III [Bacilli bacterium PM5-3]|nr:hemolysin III [Bacilli bacterium PM5-3]
MKRIEKSKLFPYTISEDIANSISHGVAALIIAIANVYLIYRASISGSITAVITFAIYGYTLMLMFLMSCLYHGIRHYTTRDVFKRLDHSFIFLLILATYCPIVFVGIKTELSYWIFAALSIVTIAGIFFKVFFSDRFKILSTIIFILMGWAAIFLIPQMINVMSNDFMLWLIVGGLAYTIGAILYAVGKFKYHHFIWHLFVVAGGFAHYYAILMYLV